MDALSTLVAKYNSLGLPNVRGWIEIVILTFFFYSVLRFFRGTRGAQVLLGFVLLPLALAVAARFAGLEVIGWILQHLSVYLVIAFFVIFQPEIRRILAEFGKHPLSGGDSVSAPVADEVVDAVLALSSDRIGALIAIEREIGTRSVRETGTRLDAEVSSELLRSIFFPHSALHDGGVVISGGRIASAACTFPLTQHEIPVRKHGTRHRAAVGMSEDTDALVVVVSEETGGISFAYKGRMVTGLDEAHLRRFLTTSLLRSPSGGKGAIARAQSKTDFSADALARAIEEEEASP
jgi:diadenylate cyclase